MSVKFQPLRENYFTYLYFIPIYILKSVKGEVVASLDWDVPAPFCLSCHHNLAHKESCDMYK